MSKSQRKNKKKIPNDSKQNSKKEEELETTKDVFLNYSFVSKLLELKEQSEILQELSKALDMTDFLTNLRSSIILDFHTYNLNFASNNSFSVEKTIYFFNIMNRILDQIKSLEDTKDAEEKIVSFAKKIVLDYAIGISLEETEIEDNKERKLLNIYNHDPVKHGELLLERKKVEVEKKLEEKEESSGRKKKKKLSSRKSARTEQPLSESQNKIIKLMKSRKIQIFSIEETKDIINFILGGLLLHFKLYNAVFKIERPKRIFEYKKFLCSPQIPFEFSKFLSENDWESKKEKERKELEEKRRIIEEEEKAKKQKEEEERIKREKEEEELKNAPVLSEENLIEVSKYLKYALDKEYKIKEESYLKRIATLKEKIDAELNKKPSNRKKK